MPLVAAGWNGHEIRLSSMDQIRLGRSELIVSVAGLGTGGDSRLGLSRNDAAGGVAVVHRALELGITYFDTAQSYGTEAILGEGLRLAGAEVIVSSKVAPRLRSGELLEPAGLRTAVEGSLQALGRERLDVYHLHRVRLADYAYCAAELYPELERLRAVGKVGHLAISESGNDPRHEMLNRAIEDGWEIVMCTFSILNQSARETVLQRAIANDVGVEVMSTARHPMNDFEAFRQLITALRASGDLGQADPAGGDFLDELISGSAVTSLPELAYRLARQEPGCGVVLTGTADLDHLADNVAAISGPPLPEPLYRSLVRQFGQLALAPIAR